MTMNSHESGEILRTERGYAEERPPGQERFRRSDVDRARTSGGMPDPQHLRFASRVRGAAAVVRR